jgi:hypothetical protein
VIDLLNALRLARQEHPEMRYGQILVNAVGDDAGTLFYVNDSYLAEKVVEWTKRYKVQKEAGL